MKKFLTIVEFAAAIAAGIVLGWFAGGDAASVLFAVAALMLIGGAIQFLHERASKVAEYAPTIPRTPMERSEKMAWILFVLSLGVYAVTRLFALDQFPIYFFTDEAIHPVQAADLMAHGWRDAQGHLLPTYFQNGQYWNLSLSVYLHAITVWLFGKSIFVTRATSAVVSIFGAAAVGLMLKWIFKVRLWWVAVLFLAITPAWFLHSRTAFETVLMVSFYAWFLLCYLLYRYRSPLFLFPALIFGAATFYAYANGQAVMLVSGFLLLISDWRYHLRHWHIGVWGALLLGFLVLPYARFRQMNPDALASQLHTLSSYWLEPLPFQNKVATFLSKYAFGLGPVFWFFPSTQDLARHLMKDYGHIIAGTLPFFLLGLGISLRNIRSAAHRAVLIALLAAPFGSALVDIAITRALMYIIPANVLIVFGVDGLIGWLKSQRAQFAAAIGLFVILAAVASTMLFDALTSGPTWYNNYGLYGMQWGTKQLFAEAIPAYLREHPNATIYLTSTWANGTDVFPRFFDVDPKRVPMYNVDWFLSYKRTIEPNAILVMTGEEYAKARASNKFVIPRIERTIKYPDGADGFIFSPIKYVDNVDALFAADQAARRALVTESFVLDGVLAQISHSLFDGGRIQDLFDGDPFTLARGLEANPLILEIQFAKPRAIHGLTATFGRMKFSVKVQLYSEEGAPVEYSNQYTNLPGEPQIEMNFEHAPTTTSKMRIEIFNTEAGDTTHIHIREMSLR